MALHDILDNEANKAFVTQVEQAPLPPVGSMTRTRYDLAKSQLGKGASERAQDSVAGTHRIPKGGGGSELHDRTRAEAIRTGSHGPVAHERLLADMARGGTRHGGKRADFDPRRPDLSSWDDENADLIERARLASEMQKSGTERTLQGLKDLATVKAVQSDPVMRQAIERAESKARGKGRRASAADVSRELLRLKAENLEPDAEMAGNKKSKKGKRGLLSKSAGRITVDLPEDGIIVRPGR
jgi:hypothetical protein